MHRRRVVFLEHPAQGAVGHSQEKRDLGGRLKIIDGDHTGSASQRLTEFHFAPLAGPA